MDEVAAARPATVVVGLGHDLAVVIPVRIPPAHWSAGRAALPRVELGLPGQLAVARVEVLADGVADDAADDGTGKCGGDLAAALAKLVADDGARHGADRRAGFLFVCAGPKTE